MNSVFEKMSASHIDGVAELEKLCFSRPWTKKMFTCELENSAAHYVVCIIDKKIVGYAGYWYTLDGADITNVAVHPKYRRMGLGGKLLDNMIDSSSALGAKKMMLEVRESNTAARALYKKYGFKEIAVRKRYYADNGENAIIMIKEW